MKRVFTKPNPRAGDIRAVFYVTKKTRKHGDRTVAAGTATHVAGFVDDGVILNSQRPTARIRRVSDVSDWYMRNGHEVLVRGLDRTALERLAAAGAVWGLDDGFHRYFEIGGDVGGNNENKTGTVANMAGGRKYCPSCPRIVNGAANMFMQEGVKSAVIRLAAQAVIRIVRRKLKGRGFRG